MTRVLTIFQALQSLSGARRWTALLVIVLCGSLHLNTARAQGSNSRDQRGDSRGSSASSDRFSSGDFSRSSSGDYSRPTYESPRRVPEALPSRNMPPISGRPPILGSPVVPPPRGVVGSSGGTVIYRLPGQGYPGNGYGNGYGRGPFGQFSGPPGWIYYLPDGNSYVISTSAGLMGPYLLPPVDGSVDAQFGPQAVLRFMGVQPAGGNFGPAPQVAAIDLNPGAPANGANGANGANVLGNVANVANMAGNGANAAGQGAGVLNAGPAKPNVRPSNAAARDRAWHQIEVGDTEFGKREYAHALDHYRSASAAAADLAEAFFRQAHGMVAIGEYAQASKALRRGLLFDPDWPDSEFRLDDLYGDNLPVKNAKLDTLEKAAAAHPQDPELQALAGIELFFDGQLDRAAPLLRHADAMYGPQASYLQGFLKKLPAAKAGAGAKPGAKNPAVPPPPAADDGLDT